MSTDTPNAAGLKRRGLIGGAGLGAAALGAMAVAGRPVAAAAQAAPDLDVAILNFALNLEYLEAEYYLRATTGAGIPASELTGTGVQGKVKGGRRVHFVTPKLLQAAEEITSDEFNHVLFLRSTLGSSAVAVPAIDFTTAFNSLAVAAGLGSSFDPFADELSFLLGAFVFEDVGVTAYSGAAPAITDKGYLAAAAGILAVEAYHAAELRTLLLETGMAEATRKIAKARAAVSGTGPGTGKPADDQGVMREGLVNIVPTDTNSIAFARTPQQVLSVVYLGGTTSGGFFPKGVNGVITSAV